MFADLHIHSTFYAFNRMRNTPNESNKAAFHPWNVPPSNTRDMERGVRARAYAQVDFPKMAAAGLRVAFVSLTPIENGFFQGSIEPDGNEPLGRELLKLASGVSLASSLRKLASGQGRQAALKELTGVLRNAGPVRRLLVSRIMNYAYERVGFMLSHNYDYWDELRREYDFLAAADGQSHTVTLDLPGGGTRQLEGVYHIVKSADDLRRIVEEDEDAIAVILTIEGGHVFSIDPEQNRVPEDVLMDRIHKLKHHPQPILFINLAHHFDNGLCGHARSLVDVADLVIDQSRRMNEDFEREDDLGLRATRALLDLDDDLRDAQDGRRILIDIKHLSPRTRKSYYAEIIEPYNARPESERDRPPIPILMSHGAYAGVPTLNALIAAEDLENDHWHRGAFNAWGINACDEDIRMIHKTRGLLGLCFDQRIAGVKPTQKLDPESWPDVLFQQILGIVDAILLDDRIPEDEKPSIWDCICIGSDFDGMIDPITTYPTALSFPDFAEDLRDMLTAIRYTRRIEAIGVDAIVEKISWRNAYDFALRNLEAG